MLEAYGNIWDLAPEYDAVVITTNGSIRKDGQAVMGRGIALEAKTRFPELPKALGRSLKEFGNHVYQYGYPPFQIFTFPVKHFWMLHADLELIKNSARELTGATPYRKVLMPRPGCGNGKLSWEQVRPVIEPLLDDRFTVVTFQP